MIDENVGVNRFCGNPKLSGLSGTLWQEINSSLSSCGLICIAPQGLARTTAGSCGPNWWTAARIFGEVGSHPKEEAFVLRTPSASVSNVKILFPCLHTS